MTDTTPPTSPPSPHHDGASIRTSVRLPIRLAGFQGDADLVTFHGLSDGREHIALGLGDRAPGKVPLVRLHSECLTGDVFGSARCDCGPQLHEALRQTSERGGWVLYLRQEGRGIGLYNKLDAYALQDQGLDTYAANRAVGFDDDQREYSPAAEMLRALGLTEVDLLTNNPAKSDSLRELGIVVRSVIPTGVFVTPCNENYLGAKVRHTGHTIALPQPTTPS